MPRPRNRSVYESFSWSKFDSSITSSSSPTSKLSIGSPLTITTTTPSYTGSTRILGCFKDQDGAGQFAFELPLNPLCTVTRSFQVDVCGKTGVASVTHGVRYDGAMKAFYEGGLTEESLEESIRKVRGWGAGDSVFFKRCSL